MPTFRKAVLDLANAVIRPAGVQLYRRGIDMDSVLGRIATDWHRGSEIRSIIDLGAARGYWSATALRLFPRARVLGVDPLIERESYLKRLKQRHGGRYDYVIAAAGEADGGSVELAVPANPDRSTVAGREGVLRQVPIRSVDAMAAEHALEGPLLLKFDTHGFEVPILAGASETLRQTEYIVMEAYVFRHVDHVLLFNEMCEHMKTLGFRCFSIVDLMQRAADGALWQMDLFFAREDNPVFQRNSFA